MSRVPDLLGRSPRTARRPDILKIAVTLRALGPRGRRGLGDLVERACAAAQDLADLIDSRPGLDAYARHQHRPLPARAGAGPAAVAAVRHHLPREGRAVPGRTATSEGLWLKATVRNPHIKPSDLRALVQLVEGNTP